MSRLLNHRAKGLLCWIPVCLLGIAVLGLLPSQAIGACTVSQPNILLILMDDTGIEHLSLYELQEPVISYSSTPFFVTQAEFEWLTFQHAWSNPVCSPTRATILSGQYGYNTGVGGIVGGLEHTWGLDPDPVKVASYLPQRLKAAGYRTGAFGKWHLGTLDADDATECPVCEDQGGDDAPRVTGGFDHFHGFLLDQQPGAMFYDNHRDTIDGAPPVANQTYLTQDITNWARDWINDTQQPEPWFAYVAHRAPHFPFHCPPAELTPSDPDCAMNPPDDVGLFQLMIESLDFEIERLLTEISFDPTDTLLIIASDNGSPEEVRLPPTRAGFVKGTVGEGGVRIPMFFGGCLAGPSKGKTVDDMVSLSDLFATILEVATGADPVPQDEDSQSLAQYLEAPDGTPVRDKVYTETFASNFNPGLAFSPCRGTQAARDANWKYVRGFSLNEALYDMTLDPWETTNVINASYAFPVAKEFRDYIDDEIGRLHAICQGLKGTGDPCIADSECCSNLCLGDEGDPDRTCGCPM